MDSETKKRLTDSLNQKLYIMSESLGVALVNNTIAYYQKIYKNYPSTIILDSDLYEDLKRDLLENVNLPTDCKFELTFYKNCTIEIDNNVFGVRCK